MKLIQSSKLSIPIIYLIEDEKELLSLPLGVPFLRAASKDYKDIVTLLEFNILLQSAKATGFPFNWKRILKEQGYNDLKVPENTSIFVIGEEENKQVADDLGEYVESISYIVDIEMLKNLKILPTWFTDIETAVKENILNSIVYNPNLYNKKLDLCTGGVDLTTPDKNLIIIDISSSIPKSISKAILLLSKTMASQFYADLLITGSKSTLYDYTEIDKIDTTKIYEENGRDNDREYFEKLVSVYRKYNTVIAFGDNDSPDYAWYNEFNKDCKKKRYERGEGKKINKWEVNNIISFHTKSSTEIAKYASWFTCSSISYMKDWVYYLED